jgi:hypothetical protein
MPSRIIRSDEIYIYFGSPDVGIIILDLVNPDFITIMYHLELTPNSYKVIMSK